MDPCIITYDNVAELNNIVIKVITEKGHLVLYEPKANNGLERDLEQFRDIIGRVGINNVLLSPEDITEESLKYLQRFINKYNEGSRSKESQYKIMGDNFYNMAVRSLQPE